MKKLIIAFAVASLFVGCGSTSKTNSHANHKPGVPKKNTFWFPDMIDLSQLRQHSAESNPYGEKFNYAREFKKLNLNAVKKDIKKVMTDSQDWWPADWGHYGPFFIRMAWHSAGTYRVKDGRGGAAGGQLRFEPLNSWPDNGNLDKARRLLWPVKKKYGKRISWADLMVLTGNVAMESMGFQTMGFAGGRTDDWEPDLVYWGPETEFDGFHRRGKDGKLKGSMSATQMALIYVNAQGPGGKPDPILAAKAIRESFGLMAMNDEETVALIAGGHTFGKAHGARKGKCLGASPSAASIEKQGLGWKNKCGKGHSEDTLTSGIEGAWTSTPTQWSMQYLNFLYAFEWELTKSPAGAFQWKPKEEAAQKIVPDAHVKGKMVAPMMLTTDIALIKDPEYAKITKRFMENPKEFEAAFAAAWFKLTHRDMGPRARYVGKEAPKKALDWQDPVPARRYSVINASEQNALKQEILKSGLSVSDLVKTAWASASSFRETDMRGGANGARVRLAPQKDWEVNDPKSLMMTINKLDNVRKSFNKTLASGKRVSLADTIVLGGNAAIEKAARMAGVRISVPFKPGRTDASQASTDVLSFSHLEPLADGFRNYYSNRTDMSPVVAMVDKADLLGLRVPEMTALVGGMRVLDTNTGDSKHGVFTSKPGTLSNDFFVNLLDMSTKWRPSATEGVYEGVDRKTGKVKYTATPVDLMFGSSSELRAVAEVYAADDGKRMFVKDFVSAWNKIMNADRF